MLSAKWWMASCMLVRDRPRRTRMWHRRWAWTSDRLSSAAGVAPGGGGSLMSPNSIWTATFSCRILLDGGGSACQHSPEAPFTELAPYWVCEVVSPSTARLDRTGKLPIYARSGVGHAWLLDPDARTLEVLWRNGEHWILLSTHSGEQHVRAEPFEVVELELGALWL